MTVEHIDKFIRTFVVNGTWYRGIPDYVVEEFREGKVPRVYGDCGTKLSTLIEDIKRRHKNWNCKVTHKKGSGEWVVTCTKEVQLTKKEIERRERSMKTLQTIAEMAGK